MGCQRATKLTTDRVFAFPAAWRRAESSSRWMAVWFFQDQMFPGLKGLNGFPGMEVIGHADRNNIHIYIREKIVVMFIDLGLGRKILSQFGRFILRTAAHCRQVKPRVVSDGLGVLDRHLTGAANPHPHLILFEIHLILPCKKRQDGQNRLGK